MSPRALSTKEVCMAHHGKWRRNGSCQRLLDGLEPKYFEGILEDLFDSPPVSLRV